MARDATFDLPAYLAGTFPKLRFDGALFYRCRYGLRFEIGLNSVPKRPVDLFEAVFKPGDDCVLVAQEWPTPLEDMAAEFYSLFSLPNVLSEPLASEPGQLEFIDGEGDESESFILRWITRTGRSFRYDLVFEATANNDFLSRRPHLNGCIYFINPRSNIIVHMYDDRGMDVVAAKPDELRALYKNYSDWILENDRARIKKSLALITE